MRIGIDARRLGGRRGMDRYTREITEALSCLDTDDEYVLFGPEGIKAKAAQYGTHVRFENERIRFRMLHNRLGKHIFGHRFRDIDVFLFPANDVWYSKYAATVVTLHDVIPARYPQWHFQTSAERRTYMRHLSCIARSADCIVTSSRWQKKEIVELVGVPEEQVFHVPLAPASYLCGRTAAASRVPPGRIEKDASFLLFVGSYEKRKNLDNLLSAFSMLAPSIPDMHLVVVAAPTRIADGSRHRALVQNWGTVSERVMFLEEVSDGELGWLYGNAAALAYPSYDEGFGLPPVEAMLCQTPVVVADVPVFREVLKDAPVFADPDDAAALSKAVLEVILDKELRQRKIERGLAVAEGLSWGETATRLHQVLQWAAGC